MAPPGPRPRPPARGRSQEGGAQHHGRAPLPAVQSASRAARCPPGATALSPDWRCEVTSHPTTTRELGLTGLRGWLAYGLRHRPSEPDRV